MLYEANWESLDSRPVPKWFGDAKFGIFIHWGLYSVPAYSKKGGYAEWYGCYLELARREGWEDYPILKFHNRTYGKDFDYADFVKDFKAEMFDANEWVKLFQNAGAKYINFVSKHHDGFCMYKTDYAHRWNSVEVGPHRDFCMELREACEGTDIKYGLYHSIYEWWHPYYLRDPEEYSVKHLLPMLKELVEKYQPNTLFTDGEWMHPSSVWHSTEFLQWLYNESSVRDYVVPNDRWGKETRGVHGGNFTTEYAQVQNFTENSDEVANYDNQKPYEECRGMGASFGYSRTENAEDYLSTKELLRHLISLVAHGSNLLLNVGPRADGTIPEIMQERLLQMGKWLKVNGNAIYGSKRYKVPNDKNCFYTVNNGKIYAVTEKYPMREMIFDSVEYRQGMKIKLLGFDSLTELETFSANGRAAVKLPLLSPDMMETSMFYTYEID